MTFRRLILLLSLIAGGLTATAEPACAQQQDRQYKLKADWMYHLGNTLVDWGDNSHTEFVIGVLGDYPGDLQAQLVRVQRLAGKIDKREIIIKRFATMDGYSRCDILFVSKVPARGSTASDRLKDALDKVGRRGVLIVSESPGLAQRGSMINFTVDVEKNRLTMEINPLAAKRAGLVLRKRLTQSRAVTETVQTTNTNN